MRPILTTAGLRSTADTADTGSPGGSGPTGERGFPRPKGAGTHRWPTATHGAGFPGSAGPEGSMRWRHHLGRRARRGAGGGPSATDGYPVGGTPWATARRAPRLAGMSRVLPRSPSGTGRPPPPCGLHAPGGGWRAQARPGGRTALFPERPRSSLSDLAGLACLPQLPLGVPPATPARRVVVSRLRSAWTPSSALRSNAPDPPPTPKGVGGAPTRWSGLIRKKLPSPGGRGPPRRPGPRGCPVRPRGPGRAGATGSRPASAGRTCGRGRGRVRPRRRRRRR